LIYYLFNNYVIYKKLIKPTECDLIMFDILCVIL